MSHREVKRSSLPEMVLQLKVKRSGNKSFNCYFSSLEHLKNFKDMIETLIENAKKAGATEFEQENERLREVIALLGGMEESGIMRRKRTNSDSTELEARTQ